MGKFDGFTCKDCVNFIRDGESRSGTCKVRKYLRDKNSRRITNIPLRCTFAKPACLYFAKRTDELKDSEPPKTYAELLAENAALRERLEKAVELPVKVGGKVYMPWEWDGASGVAELTVSYITFFEGEFLVNTDFESDDIGFLGKYSFGEFRDYDFGTKVFTTHEAAEARLAELKGAEHE